MKARAREKLAQTLAFIALATSLSLLAACELGLHAMTPSFHSTRNTVDLSQSPPVGLASNAVLMQKMATMYPAPVPATRCLGWPTTCQAETIAWVLDQRYLAKF